jgi:hypothetical protein
VVGKSKEEAVRLSEAAVHNWARIDGEFSGKGVDLLALSFPRFLNVTLVWVLEHLGQEDAEKFLADLKKPLKGYGAPADDGFDDSYEQINQ